MSAQFCPSCGTGVPSGSSFCAKCGKAIPHADGPAARPAAQPGPGGAEKVVFELKPLVVRTLFELFICIITVGLGWLVYWAARMGVRYAITTQRIEMRRGIITIRSSSLDLFRIEDFEVVEPFFLRTRGAGDLQIWSMDKSAPQLVLAAIPDVKNVYETVRSMTRDERRRQGVRVIEGM